MGAVTPNPATAVLQASDSLTIEGTVSTSAGDPPGSFSLLAYFEQASEAKWTRFGAQLCGFTKVAVGGGGASAPFALTLRVRDFEAFEPSTGDYEVMTGTYRVMLGTSADTAGKMGSFEVRVNGTYAWAWDFTQ